MKQYIVDAFAEHVFSGNPAAVCVTDAPLPDDLMRKIAVENNFSETAFAVPERDAYRLRWFTPGGEIDFCGHATLGTAYVLHRFYHPDGESLRFRTMHGELTVQFEGSRIEMDFPAYPIREIPVTPEMTDAIGVQPVQAFQARDLMLVLDSEEAVRTLAPDPEKLMQLDGLCIAVTARGTQYDCVSRVFVPKMKIPEDPVTGSAHCLIAPYWAKRLGKTELTAYQASARGGVLYAAVSGDRVRIAGTAVLFAEAEILPDWNAESAITYERRNYGADPVSGTV